MALRYILTEGEPTLLKKSRIVKDFNQRLHILLDDMADTLRDAGGVGLAAPQVGVLRRVVLVLEADHDEAEEQKGEDRYIELINPEMILEEGQQEGPEGCLSVPGVCGIVKRPKRVKVRAQDRNGDFFEVEGEGLLARAYCHELDHLEGRLFLEIADRLLSMEELEEYYAQEDAENSRKDEDAE